jgi:hypothetical protein
MASSSLSLIGAILVRVHPRMPTRGVPAPSSDKGWGMTVTGVRHRDWRALIALTVLLAACSAGPTPVPTAVTHAITGTLTLDENPNLVQKVSTSLGKVTSCSGTGGFADIKDGAQVVIRDAAGAIVGTATIAVASDLTSTFDSICRYTFATTVPDSAFYTVEIANRKGPTYQRVDLEANGWRVDLTLGG